MSSRSTVPGATGGAIGVQLIGNAAAKSAGLCRSETYFEALFENARDAFIVLGAEGQFVDANPAACQLIGLPLEEVIRRNVADTIETTTDFDAAWAKFLRERTYRGQRWLVRPDGERRLIEIRATADVVPGLHFAVWRDITDRYFLDSDLIHRERDQAMGRLAGGIAHEFTNLLNVIAGHTELLAHQISFDQEHQRHIDRILATTKQAAALTAQLAALGRQQVLSPAVLDLAALVQSSREILQKLLPENINLVLSSDEQPALVCADRTQILQVLFALTSNASELPADSTVAIDVKTVNLQKDLKQPGMCVPAGDYVVVTVEIALRSDASLGKPLSSTPSSHRSMSVPIPRTIATPPVGRTVKQNNGFFFRQDNSPESTVFSIYFPRANRHARSMPEAPRGAALGGKETVLLVEDDPALREAMREYLKSLGYRVLRAGDGAAALEIARSGEPIDALVTDLRMPKMDGHELANELTAEKTALKVMFVSGNFDREFIDAQNEKGRSAMLSKPFEMRALAGILRDLLDGKKPEQHGC
jgi:two-component system, cell cycle sensor histidine kinase and response regulator CckA